MSQYKLSLFSLPYILALVFHQHVDSARILAFIPIASYSHQMFFQQLWRELALRGHDMVIATTDPTGEVLSNFREISLNGAYGPMKSMLNAVINESIIKLLLSSQMMNLLNDVIIYEMNLPEMQELINNKSEQFDLIILEHVLSMHIGFKHRFKCPMIGVISLDAYSLSHEVMGNPTHPILYPTSLLPSQEEMSFVERIAATFFQGASIIKTAFSMAKVNQITKAYFGQDTPDLEKLYEETDMLFVNANPLFNQIRPHTPSTINLAGGIHMKKPKPLPEDMKQFLDGATKGAIYFSLGSNVKSKELSTEMRKLFINVLASLPYKILWKFEDDSLPGKPDNVMITKWAPQQDILRHPNIKLFISQGGIQSLEEALFTHVPLVVVGFLADQMANAAKVEAKGLGLSLDRHTLTENKLKSAILQVVDNKAYRDNIKQFASRIQDEPFPPLEKAVWWTEYVLRHKGAQHLKGPKIPSWQYYYFDIVALLGGVWLAFISMLYGIVKLVIREIKKLRANFKTNQRNASKDKKKKTN